MRNKIIVHVVLLAAFVLFSGFTQANSVEAREPFLVISNVLATNTQATSTIISWETNKLSDSKVTYWKTASTSTKVSRLNVSTTPGTLEHSIFLENLSASTTYTYFVTSVDVSGKKKKSPEQTFKTLQIPVPEPLIISNVFATSTTDSSAVVNWQTNRNSISDTVTYWQTSSSSTSTVSVSSSTIPSIVHNMPLNNLQASTTYLYFVTSIDSSGVVATSSINSFRTGDFKRCSQGYLGSPECSGVLALFTSVGDGGTGPGATVDSVRFFLAYGLKNLGALTSLSGGVNASSSIGIGVRIEPGQTPMFDLSANNTSNFNNFVSYLTNGIDEVLMAANGAYALDGSMILGSGGGDWESSQTWVNGSPDLHGKQIDFIRFIVNKNNVSQGPSGTNFEYSYTVEVWGGDAPPTATITSITPYSPIAPNQYSISSVHIEWDTTASNLSYKKTWRKFGDGDWILVGIGQQNYFDDLNIGSGTYSYKVSACASGTHIEPFDCGPDSNIMTTTLAMGSGGSDITPPSTPTIINIWHENDGYDFLSFTESTDNVGVDGYNIYVNGTYIKSVCCTPAAGGFQNNLYTGLSYTIAAYDDAGNISEQSTPVIAP
jgi:hypothetical protein